MILVISYPGEEHTADVIQRLERQGREVLLMDLADFPTPKGLALSWSAAERPSYVIDGPQGLVDLKNARVGWWRRVRPYSVDKLIGSPSMRAFAESETSQAISGMLDALPCPWVNPRANDDAAHRKPYQWTVAREV